MPWAPEAMTYGLSGMVDAFGIVMGVYWLCSDEPMIRRWGRFFTIAAVVGSTVLTCWAIGRLSGAGAAVLGALPAAVLFGATKMVTMRQGQQARTRDVLGEAAAQVATAEQGLAEAVAALEGERSARAEREAELLARLERLESAAEPVRDATTDTGPIPVQERTGSAPGSRVTNIAAGTSLADRGRAFVHGFIAEHDREPSGGEVDAAIGAKDSYGRKLLARMRKAGELPAADAARSA
jgi:hypothetical protein